MNNRLHQLGASDLRALADLIDQRDALNARINEAMFGPSSSETPPKPAPEEHRFTVPINHEPKAVLPRGRRHMSAEARARISRAAKRRWKAARTEGRNHL